MPTYEYACAACGHEWEQTQRITEAPIETCPACAEPMAHRLISRGTNFILKGSGWYSDLYGSPKPAPSKPDATKDATKSEPDSTEKKTDKPDVGGATSTGAAEKPAAKPTTTDTPGSKSSAPAASSP
jgi:putative FmdB family regulatory protein